MSYVNQIPGLLAALPTINGKALMRSKVLFPVTALALLTALLLPLLGPLADHHFAERQPGHLHIYLAGVPDSSTFMIMRPSTPTRRPIANPLGV